MPTGRIVALIIDRPGGPLDQLIADPDVSTFLNDRFDAHFVHPEKIGVRARGPCCSRPRDVSAPGPSWRRHLPHGSQA